MLMPSVCLYLKILLIVIILVRANVASPKGVRVRPRACPVVRIQNAVVRLRHNYKIMRIMCNVGFTLQGSNIVGCENGKWDSAVPVCAKEGCANPKVPANGMIITSRLTANLYCHDKYKVAGGRITYCNGTSWDRPLGECRPTSEEAQLACDFETDDLCGWTHDETHYFDWKHVMAANIFQQLRTGPTYDHTTLTANAGHYMLMESFDQPIYSVARLVSPVYSSNITSGSACFRFFYFMYGASVNTLSVYVKPMSVDMSIMTQNSKYQYFTLTGNQENAWREGFFKIPQMSEEFQIVIEGTTGGNHLSDIAIDDVHLMPFPECYADSTTEESTDADSMGIAIYDVQSCEGRCLETNSSGYGIKMVNDKFVKTCDCHWDCETLQTCCSNYRAVCEVATQAPTEVTEVIENDKKEDSYTFINKDTSTTASTNTTVSTSSVKTNSTTTKSSTRVTLTPSTSTITRSTNTTTTPTTSTSRKFTTARTKVTTVTIRTPVPTAELRTKAKTTTTESTKSSRKPTTTDTTTFATIPTTKTTKKTSTRTAATVTSKPTTPTTTKRTTTRPTFSTTMANYPTSLNNLYTTDWESSVDQRYTSTPVTWGHTPNIEMTPPKRREKVVSWESNHPNKRQNESSLLPIFVGTVILILIIVMTAALVRHYGTSLRIRLLRLCRSSSDVYSDSTTLTYSQANECLLST